MWSIYTTTAHQLYISSRVNDNDWPAYGRTQAEYAENSPLTQINDDNVDKLIKMDFHTGDEKKG